MKINFPLTLAFVLAVATAPILGRADTQAQRPAHPPHVQAFLDVCLDAVLLGRGHEAITARIKERLGEPVDSQPFQAFLPDDDLTAWSYASAQGEALVVQPRESASCHVSLVKGTSDLAVEFFEEYVKDPPSGFTIAYDQVQPIMDDDGVQTHWSRVVVWSLPGVSSAGLMTTLLIPSEGSSDKELVGVLGTELVKTTLLSKAEAQ